MKKNSMKILFITSSYTPKGNSAVIRHNALVKGLIQNGCDVDVYTVKWPEENRSNFFLKENNGNIHYSELSSLSNNVNLKKKINQKNNKFINIIKNFIKSIVYYPDACFQWKSAIKVENPSQYDFMISSSFTNSSHFVANEIKKLNPSLFWIQVWGDPWYYDDLITPWYLKPFVFFDENKLLKSANTIVYVSKVTADLMKDKKKFIASKINYIPRSYYSVVEKKLQPIVRNYSITYAGNITSSTGRNILDFINAISFYNETNEPAILVNIYSPVIDGIMKDQLLSKACVNINSGVDFDKIPDIYANSDALLFISNKGGTSMIPGKFYDYLGTNLPIICLMADINDNVSTFVKSFGDKCIVLENDTEKIIDKLPNIKLAMEKTYPIIKDYSPKVIAKRYIDLFNENSLTRH